MTLHYEFPYIEHIDDVLPHIAGRDEFIVVPKETGITLIRYVVVSRDTFPACDNPDEVTSRVLRECRGIGFNTETGFIVRRPLQKFFNLGEREDTQTIDLSKPHVILEKLDGSMITPFELSNGDIRWGTKMGVTTTSMQAECFVATHPQYEDFASLCLARGRTPIFEWCSRQQRIVLDYPEDKLVLLAVREMVSGQYLPRDVLKGWSEAYDIPLVASYNSGATTPVSLERLVTIVRSMEDEEGIVIAFNDGHMVKVKSDWYVGLHRAKAAIETRECDVVKLILEEKIDDILPLLSDDDKQRVLKFASDIHADIGSFATKVLRGVQETKAQGITRKTFGEACSVDCRITKSACYALWDTTRLSEAVDWVIANILRQYPIGNVAYLRKVKPILSNVKWRGKEI